MKTQILFTTIICCLLSSTLFGQKKEFKFGKIENSDLTATQCPIDSSADAYVLGDFGNTSFEYDNASDNFKSIFEGHIRIKILKKTALHHADFVIPLYRSANGRVEEKVSDLKGCTYNLEDGKVVVSKLEKSSIFKEEVNKNRVNMRFTLPNVKEGSVLEVAFKIYSESWDVRDWDFQSSIPTIVSQYEVRAPEYFNYKVFQNGYEHIEMISNSIASYFNYSWEEHDRSGMRIPNSRQTEKIDYQMKVTTCYGENIKAFHDEPYMSSKRNYLSSIEFELQSTQFPYSIVKSYTTNWTSITKSLLDYEDFGDILRKKGATDDIVNSSTLGKTQPIEKATAIFNFIRDNFKWNGSNRLYASAGIRKTIENRAGNSADINLLLVTALKNAGFKSEPVVLSTRDNGIIIMALPVLQKLNYVIAMVEIDGKRYLLDATDKHAGFGFVPEKCLNGQGRIISEEIPGDIDLTSKQLYLHSISTKLKLNESGELTGSWDEMRMGYAAHNFRDAVDASKSKDDYIQEKQKKHPGLTITNYAFENLDSLPKQIGIKYDISLTGQVESTGNLLMIHPLLSEQVKENPFKIDERKFPIDYSYNHSYTYSAQFEIPQGYQVETLPKAQSIALPERHMLFAYSVVANGNTVQVIRRFLINQSLFLPEEYKSLQEFYNQMVAKEAEVIVLKKL